MVPLFVVVTTGGDVYVCTSRDDAKGIAAGTVFRISALPAKLKLVTLSGAASPYTLTVPGAINTGGDKENHH